MVGPHHIYIADDVAYLVDREDCVVLRYTLDGKPLQVIGNRGQASDTGIGPDFDNENDLPPHAAGPFNYPTKMVPHPAATSTFRTAIRIAGCTASPPTVS